MAVHPAIAALFRSSAATSRSIEGGSLLYEAGDAASAVFLVTNGAFAVFRTDEGRRSLLGIVRPGEIVGEAAVFAGTARSATVAALRDSTVRALPAADFFNAAKRSADAMTEIARLLIKRRRSANAQRRYEAPKIVALVGLTPSLATASLARRLASAIVAEGRTVAVVDAAEAGQGAVWWDNLEHAHDIVLCAVEHGEAGWAATCRRQADRMLVVGHSSEAPPNECHVCVDPHFAAWALVDLVLVHDGARPAGTAQWAAATRAARVHHVLENDGYTRLARRLLGTGVALALSGGGARAFAHIGAVRALRRAGITIDAICGTSMGAIVAAGIASGWDDEELDARMRTAFVTSNPLDDIALPFVAMTRGCKVDTRLQAQFGDFAIEDLPLPFFCVSADLGAGELVVHRSGDLPMALRASISLPGILPPVIAGSQVLVDGGALLNLPTGLLRAEHDGTIVAVDVSRSQGLTPEDVRRPSPLAQWFFSGAWRRGPPLMSILMRSATIAATPELRAAKEAADLYVMPDVDDIEIRNWRAFDRAVDAGEAAMTQALKELDGPIGDLRRRREDLAAMPM